MLANINEIHSKHVANIFSGDDFPLLETPNREDYVFLVQHQKHSSYIQMDLLISHIYDVSSSSKWEELNNIIA